MKGVRAVCAVLLTGFVAAATAGASPRRADLVESAVSVAQHGRSVRVADVVRNSGRATAARTRTGYVLGGVAIGGRLVGPLRAGTESRGTRTLLIPPSVHPGERLLVACADLRGRVHEANERNNCRVARTPVVVRDVTPPRFDGLLRATTCIPGPVGGPVRNTAYSLTWSAAADDATPPGAIVYEIYEAHESGAEDYAHPSYVSDPGATTFVTPPLPDNVTHYFVVRARDRAGNVDRNTVERPGANLCL